MLYASDFRRIARDALRGKWVKTAFILLLAGLLGASAGIGGIDMNIEYNMSYESLGVSLEEFREIVASVAAISIALTLLAIFVGSIVQVGMFRMGERVLEGEKPRAGMLFPKGIYWKAIGLNLYTTLLVSLWSLLFVIPGIIASYRYAMASYILAQNPQLGPVEAVNLSKMRMQGNKLRLFSLELSFFGWALLASLPAGIGMAAAMGIVGVAGSSIASVLPILLISVLLSLAGSLFLNAYMHIAVCAFFRELYTPYSYAEPESPVYTWAEDAGEQGGEAAAAERTASGADEGVARDIFFNHGCSRRRLREENMLEAYEALGVDSSFEQAWIREYGRNLMARFNSDPDALDGLLSLVGEYALDDLLDRVIERIDRHIRRESLPDAEILNMAGRTLALVSSGVFADRESYVQRKRTQLADMAGRLELRLQQNDPEGSWREAMALVRRMGGGE